MARHFGPPSLSVPLPPPTFVAGGAIPPTPPIITMTTSDLHRVMDEFRNATYSSSQAIHNLTETMTPLCDRCTMAIMPSAEGNPTGDEHMHFDCMADDDLGVPV